MEFSEETLLRLLETMRDNRKMQIQLEVMEGLLAELNPNTFITYNKQVKQFCENDPDLKYIKERISSIAV